MGSKILSALLTVVMMFTLVAVMPQTAYAADNIPLTATPGNGKVELAWTTPGDIGDTITKYQLSYGATTGYAASWTDITGSDASTTTHTVTGLTNGTSYTFEVRAVYNTSGNGASSGTQTATPGVFVCQIGSTGYATLDNALAAVTDATPTTIKLLDNITYSSQLEISGKKITFDLNGYDLNVNNTVAGQYGLRVTSFGEVGYTGAGEFNITGSKGIFFMTNCIAEVTNVTANGTFPYGYGIECGANTSGASVTVNGNITAYLFGVDINGDSNITVKGNITVTNTGAGETIGVRATANGKVIVDGTITVPAGKKYLHASGVDYTPEQGVVSIAKPGYLEYGSGSTVVYVKIVATAPAAPGSFAATPDNGQVVLTWTTPSDGSSALTGYEILTGALRDIRRVGAPFQAPTQQPLPIP
jgi:hypothetical protein